MNSFVRLWTAKRILRKGRMTGCMILIALVMAPVVIALIFSESMMNGITEKLIYVTDGHIQVSSFSFLDVPVDQIYSMDRTVVGYALMYSSSETASVMIKGVEDDYFNQKRMGQLTITRLDPELRSNLNGIIVGSSAASHLGIKVGDRVALMVVPDTEQGVLRPVMLQVTGIYSTGYGQIDNQLAFVDYSYAEKLFTNPLSFRTEITALSSDNLPQVRTDGIATGWQERNQAVFMNFVNSRQMIALILLVIVFVAAFYTASTANQIIEDDIEEIAVSKLLGASDRQIRTSAFLSIFAVTLTGMLIGLVLGIAVGTNLSPLLSALSRSGVISLSLYLLEFDAVIPWPSILFMMGVLVLVSTFAVMLSLGHTRKITPMRLFTGL